MLAKTKTNKIFEYQARIFWLLGMATIFLATTYVYLTISSIVDVASRKRIENEIGEMRGKSVALELTYIEAEKNITPELASSMGFMMPETKFASRQSGVAKVSLNNED